MWLHMESKVQFEEENHSAVWLTNLGVVSHIFIMKKQHSFPYQHLNASHSPLLLSQPQGESRKIVSDQGQLTQCLLEDA